MSSAPGIPTTEIDPIGTPPSELVRALREMARRGPLHRMASGEYLVVTQAGVRDVLKNVDSFSGTVGDVGALAEEDTMLSGIPEPRHGMVRKIVNSALAYHHASLVEPYVRDLAKTLIAEALDACATSVDGSVEIMAAYARRIPSAVIARILGIPADDYELFARWSDEVLARQENDGGSNRPLLDLHPEFTRFITEQVEQRRTATNPPSDVITRLLTNEVDGERLSTRAVCTQAMFLVVAGNETTRNLIGNVLRRLALEPEILSRIHADPALIPRVVEESLRIEPPVQLTARTCTRDIRIDGVEVRKGDRLVLSLNAANRDETLYSDPGRIPPRSSASTRSRRLRRGAACLVPAHTGANGDPGCSRGLLERRRRDPTGPWLRRRSEPRLLGSRPAHASCPIDRSLQTRWSGRAGCSRTPTRVRPSRTDWRCTTSSSRVERSSTERGAAVVDPMWGSPPAESSRSAGSLRSPVVGESTRRAASLRPDSSTCTRTTTRS
ncbi:MAG: cytochrome P450 [Myxococcota bacterium]